MINYKYTNKSPDIQKNLKAITEFGKDNWLYVNELDGILIFSKKVTAKIDREKKQAIKSEEFIEFSNKYPKKSGLSSDKLIDKYNKLKNQHTEIMEGLDRYINYIEVEKLAPRFIKNAETWINNSCWQDEYKVLENRFAYHKKWLAELLQPYKQHQIELILDLITSREKTNHKAVTEGVAKEMINKKIKSQQVF